VTIARIKFRGLIDIEILLSEFFIIVSFMVLVDFYIVPNVVVYG